MSLFLEPDAHEMVMKPQSQLVPIQKLLNNRYICYYHSHILHNCEKDKIFIFFNQMTKKSSKKIKRVKLNDPTSANNLYDRIVTKFNREFLYRNDLAYVANRVLPTMEIIKWPGNEEVDTTYNELTRNTYLPKNKNIIYGTFIIPILRTTCSTMLVDCGSDGINVINCDCQQKCTHKKGECPCWERCICDEPVRLNVNEDQNVFYMSELEPIEIIGEERLNLYVHIEYRLKS